MARLVQCTKLNKEAEGVAYKPFENALGERIWNEISQEAWMSWVEHSKMMVNEYRLDLTSQRAQQVLLEECERFLFGGGSSSPEGFVSPTK